MDSSFYGARTIRWESGLITDGQEQYYEDYDTMMSPYDWTNIVLRKGAEFSFGN
jgi:hypothetical protein